MYQTHHRQHNTNTHIQRHQQQPNTQTQIRFTDT